MTIYQHRKYTVDTAFFDHIDSEEKAYWLGFLTADGSVYRSEKGRPCGITVKLAAKDHGHLTKLRAAINGNHPIHHYLNTCATGTPCRSAVITIGSVQLADALGKLGVTPAKSLTVKPCQIAANLERHYWRGLFDGNGCLHRRTDRRRWSLDLSGTWDIVDGFRQFILRNGIETDAVPLRAGKIWRFQASGVALPRRTAKLLYDGSSVHLNRKFRQYRDLVVEKDVQRRTGEQGWLAAKEAYERLGNWRAAAEAVGIPWRTVYRLKKKWEAA